MSTQQRAAMPKSKITDIFNTMKPVMQKIRKSGEDEFAQPMTRGELMGWLILGPPGWAKTRGFESKFKYALVMTVPEYIEDELNVLAVDEGKLVHMMLPKIRKLVDFALDNPTVPTCLMLDELPLASEAVAKIAVKWAGDREIAGVTLPQNVVIIATGNLRKHQAGAGSALAHMISRYRLYEIEPDVEAWLNWGATTLHPDVIAQINMNPVSAYCWTNEASDEDMAEMYRSAARDWIPYPNARSWTAFSDALKTNESMNMADISGFIGPERAAEFQALKRCQIPGHNDLISGKAKMPDEPMPQWMCVIRLGQLLTPGNSKSTCALIKNLNPEMVEVFLKVAGRKAEAYLKDNGVKTGSPRLALIHRDAQGASMFPGFVEELLAPGSRFAASLDA